MAKNINSKKLNITMATLVVVLIGVGSSGITNYANNKHQVKDTVIEVEELKADGCDPAKQAHTDIQVINVKLEGLKEDIDDSRTEQRADTKEILAAIKEKNP